MNRLVAAIAVLCLPAFAHASPTKRFAWYLQVKPTDVSQVHSYRVVGRRTVSRVFIGLVNRRASYVARAVIVRCRGKRCWHQTYYLGSAERLLARGIVDLRGRPRNLTGGSTPDGRHIRHGELVARGMRWPALVLRTWHRYRAQRAQKRWEMPSRRRRPTRRRSLDDEQLILLSLRAADWKRAKLFSKFIQTGGSVSPAHGFSLVRGKGATLDIGESRPFRSRPYSHCLKPKPETFRHVLKAGRYVLQVSKGPGGIQPRSGCH